MNDVVMHLPSMFRNRESDNGRGIIWIGPRVTVIHKEGFLFLQQEDCAYLWLIAYQERCKWTKHLPMPPTERCSQKDMPILARLYSAFYGSVWVITTFIAKLTLTSPAKLPYMIYTARSPYLCARTLPTAFHFHSAPQNNDQAII